MFKIKVWKEPIYWNSISEDVPNLKWFQDNILNKETIYMGNYTPSFKSLIEQHINVPYDTENIDYTDATYIEVSSKNKVFYYFINDIIGINKAQITYSCNLDTWMTYIANNFSNWETNTKLEFQSGRNHIPNYFVWQLEDELINQVPINYQEYGVIETSYENPIYNGVKYGNLANWSPLIDEMPGVPMTQDGLDQNFLNGNLYYVMKRLPKQIDTSTTDPKNVKLYLFPILREKKGLDFGTTLMKGIDGVPHIIIHNGENLNWNVKADEFFYKSIPSITTMLNSVDGLYKIHLVDTTSFDFHMVVNKIITLPYDKTVKSPDKLLTDKTCAYLFANFNGDDKGELIIYWWNGFNWQGITLYAFNFDLRGEIASGYYHATDTVTTTLYDKGTITWTTWDPHGALRYIDDYNTYEGFIKNIIEDSDNAGRVLGVYFAPNVSTWPYLPKLWTPEGNLSSAVYYEYDNISTEYNFRLNLPIWNNIFPQHLNDSNLNHYSLLKKLELSYLSNNTINYGALMGTKNCYINFSDGFNLNFLPSDNVNVFQSQIHYGSMLFTPIDEYIQRQAAVANSINNSIHVQKQMFGLNMFKDTFGSALAGGLGGYEMFKNKSLGGIPGIGSAIGASVGAATGIASAVISNNAFYSGLKAQWADIKNNTGASFSTSGVIDSSHYSYILKHQNSYFYDFTYYKGLTKDSIIRLNNVLFLYGNMNPILANLKDLQPKDDFNYISFELSWLSKVLDYNTNYTKQIKELILQRIGHGIRIWKIKPIITTP